MVISDNIQNEFNDLIVVAPITTDNIGTIEPFEVFIENTGETGLNHPSKVQFIYPFTVDKDLRLVGQKRLGVVKEEIMERSKFA